MKCQCLFSICQYYQFVICHNSPENGKGWCCSSISTCISSVFPRSFGAVEWWEGGVYLTSAGHPTDIGLHVLLGKTCYPCSRYGSRGNVFISSTSILSFLFLFLPCPSLLSLLLCLFSLSLCDDTKWPTRVDVSLNPNTIKIPHLSPFSFILGDIWKFGGTYQEIVIPPPTVHMNCSLTVTWSVPIPWC